MGVIMLDDMENLKILSVFHKKSKPFGDVKSKSVSCFAVRVSGTMRYIFGDKEFVVNPGEMIFLKKGSCYKYKAETEEDSLVTIINLEGVYDDIEPNVYSVKDFYDIDYIMYHMADMWVFGNHSQRYQCLSALYGLLSFVSAKYLQEYHIKTKVGIIAPAVSYLKKNIYNCDLQIDNLHLLCGISHTYFRRLFISKYGTTPKKYVLNKRLKYARTIIESEESISVRELAQMAGYRDALYFGKVFKKHYGVSPSNMNK